MKFHIYFLNKTALHLAVILNNEQIVQILLNHKGIDMNAVDDISFFIFLNQISIECL